MPGDKDDDPIIVILFLVLFLVGPTIIALVAVGLQVGFISWR